ncbi:adhesion G protein-coupled receptor L2 isoform X2 [Rhipicephalus microplus]|uniref:adhesion G protein-coupled receptor L2 isoform X2 n=1 Tax=Rhipicephalus microplus TaxID=6941 RepID=UPI003F6ACB83
MGRKKSLTVGENQTCDLRTTRSMLYQLTYHGVDPLIPFIGYRCELNVGVSVGATSSNGGSELECHTTSSITTARLTESPAETAPSPDVAHGNTTVSPPATSTASEPEDAFQKRLNMLLKEQKLVLAPAPEGKSRRRRAVMQKASEVWALFRGTHLIDTELQKRRDLPDMDKCEETVYRGITWPATPPDKCAEMDCPNWNVGIMTWCCNSRGYWKTQSPNTAQCVQPSVLLLKSQITASSKKYLADIIETVSDFVGNNSLEVGGDLVAIVDLLDMGVARSDTGDNYPGRIASAAQALRVGGLTASTVDALLSRDKPWNEVPAQTRHSCATTLLLIMDVAGIILSAASSEQKILAFINFQMNIISSTTTHIANQTMLLPAPGNTSNRSYSTAQLRIARNSSGAEEDSPLGPAGEDGAADVVIVFTEFPRLDKLLLDDGADIGDPKQELNSPAISIRVGSEAPGLVLGAHVELALPMLHPDAENPTCVFWDTLINEWSPDGCQVGRRNGTHVVCFCQHLSNFAVLMDLHGALPRDERSTLPLRIITWTGCSASVLCLCLCVTVFGCFRSLRNTRTSIHLNLCICLLVAEVVLMFGIDQTKHKVEIATICNELIYAFSTLVVLVEAGYLKPPQYSARKLAGLFCARGNQKQP